MVTKIGTPDSTKKKMLFQKSMETQFSSLPDPTLPLTSFWRDAVHKDFSDQAFRRPQNAAVIDSRGSWSYGELESLSNQLANFLHDHGVCSEEVVAIYADRNAELVAALLGVLKAGAAFLILDSAYPADNLARRARLARCRAWLSVGNGGKLPDALEQLAKAPECRCKLSLLGNDALHGIATLKKYPARLPRVTIDPDGLAYVAFTSGSTGKPRGIMGTHRPLPHFIGWQAQTFELTENDRFSMLSGLSHDPLLRDIFTPLYLGAAICIPNRDDIEIPGQLALWMEKQKITVLHLTPTMGRLLALGEHDSNPRKKLHSLRYAFFGGDVLKTRDVQFMRDLAPAAVCVNFYGTTETPQAMSYYVLRNDVSRLPGDGDENNPIGSGIEGVQLLVLDKNCSQASVGQTGEIYVRTPYLSRGYLDDSNLDRERFIPNPFSNDAADRLYRTGDLGRYREDGSIDFIGRADTQVKIRGFRVELSEVETALEKHPAVSDCAVIAREIPKFSSFSKEKILAACFVSRQPMPPSAAELRYFLKELLPDFMIPSTLIAVPALPFTPNGKLNRDALGQMIETASVQTTPKPVSPQNPTETKLCQIWCEVLSLKSVGTHDNFFELGGHSLLATMLAFRIREVFEIELPLRVLFECPTVELLTSYLSKEAQQNKLPTPLPQVQADPARRHEPFPLTDVQMAYWIGRGESFELGNVACHLYREIDIENLDLPRFEKAFQTLINRHEMLRAVVLADGTQKILESVPPYRIEKLDLHREDPAKVEKKLLEVREKLAHQVLPVDRWPLFELRVTRFDERRSRLHLSIDALITDALSLQIIARELHQLYHLSSPSLPQLKLSFRDYILAETSIKQIDLYRKSAEYWEKRLENLPPAPDLPLAKNPGSITYPRFSRRTQRLDIESWQRFKRLAGKSGVSPSAALFAAYAEVLAIWSKSPRFTVNLTLFNRLPLDPQINNIVGDFTSLTMLAVDFTKPEKFMVHARKIQEQLWDDLDHGYFNGLQVLRRLTQLRGSRVNMPIVFTSVVNLGDIDQNSVGWDVFGKIVYDLYQTPQVWLDQTIKEDPNGLCIEWDSIDELFPEGMLDEMFATFGRLLDRLSRDAEAWEQTEFNLLPDSHLQIRAQANRTQRPVPNGLLHDGFLRQTHQRPGDTALISERRRFTYDELHRLSNTLARRIREAGAIPNTLVAVVMEKGWEQAAAVLGILESGAAYLPVDANLPQERLHHLLEHGQVQILLTQPWIEPKLKWPDHIKRIVVDDVGLEKMKAEPLDPVQGPEDIAYVIFTSGSTGLPKGVVIDHRGALNTIVDINERFGIGPNDRVLALSALNFDLSVYDIFGLLAAGGAVVMPESGAKRDPERWLRWIEEEKITLWNSVPALMEMATAFAESRSLRLPNSLRTIMMGGDWIPVNLPDRIRKLRPGIEIISLGGVTEASIWSILFPIKEVSPDWKSIPYGKPMINQQFHVLDERLRPCPIWVPGQLFIGGVGLAKGYWRDQKKTDASFITHPSTGERLYRTGDLGRYWPDGNIEFLGREDFQVKISGFRIELGEIEAVLSQHPGIREALVTAHDDGAGHKRLVAYLVGLSAEAPSNESLRNFLKDRLPEYMVPNFYVPLESLPLSSNGKVDRKALPAPDRIEATKKRDRVNPRTPTEEILTAIWKAVLRINHFGIHDNFLELGGNSLQAIQILSRVRESFHLNLSLPALFEAPTIAEMAQLIEDLLIEEIDKMSEDETRRLLAETPVNS